jgi:hypothetical protein
MTAFAANVPPEDEEASLQVHFALAKALDDLGQTDKAFEHMTVANRLKRKSTTYAEAETLELFDRIRKTVTTDVVKRFEGAGNASQVPIFIVGMPQSGTSLVAQILAAHPSVALAGETRQVHDALLDLRGHVAGKRAYPELMHDATPQDIGYFGHTLSGRLSRLAPQSRHVVDSMPSNFFFLGLICLALPKAKVIHVSRNAADTCLSAYSKLFFSEINHAYDLVELGRYHRAYSALMAHWRQVLPTGSVLEVRYEDLAANPAGEAQRIASHCALPANGNLAATAEQVRPSASSVDRWKLYGAHLAPLLAELGDTSR